MPADLPPPPSLTRPVQAPIVRRFEYRGSPFARGLHRGVDLAAAGGTPVRAPCSGRVAHAGPTPAGRAVTLRCDGWSVTLLPLHPSVSEGRHVSAGQGVGRVQAGGDHTGLHLGLRRTADPFGYVDPAPRLRDRTPGNPVIPGPGRAPRAAPRLAPRPRSIPVARPGLTRPSSEPLPATPALTTTPPIPWPAWAGLGLLALGLGIAAARAVAGRPAATVRRAWASTSRRRSSTSTRRPISGTRTR